MNIQEYAQKLEGLTRKAAIELTNEVRVPAANLLRANVLNRISIDGKASDGSQIGQYSTKPAYYSRKQFVKTGVFKPQGKSGTNKSARSMYIPDGYKGLRGIQGMPNAKVIADYTGDLKLDYQQETEGTTILFGFTKETESRKHHSLTKRYGKNIFPATRNELEEFNESCKKGFAEVTLRILK